jgi:hypothetical protein
MTNPFIPYAKAAATLAEKLNATREEIAAWVWLGPNGGGLSAYQGVPDYLDRVAKMKAAGLEPPPFPEKFDYGYIVGTDDYLSLKKGR